MAEMAGDAEEKDGSMRENIKFALTAFFLLMAVFSLFTFLFLVPFFIEPALATIYMEFDTVPVTCQTTEASFHRGLSNCNWSSCREGCTREVYECWHIRVRYLSRIPVGQADSRSVRDRIAQYQSAGTDPPRNFKQLQHLQSGKDSAPDASSRLQSVLPLDDEEDVEDEVDTYVLADQGGQLHFHEARLQPNVKGCGYPPHVECNKAFAPRYGVVGNNFSCYYSLVDPTLAITQLDIGAMWAQLIYCLTIPIFLFIVSCSYLMYAYCVLYAGLPTPPDRPSLALDDEHDAAIRDVVIDQPEASPTPRNGRYQQLFQQPSPDCGRKRVVRRTKSGMAISSSVLVSNSAFDQPTGMRLSKSMGDSRRMSISPVAHAKAATATAFGEPSKDWPPTSLGSRNNPLHSPSPSEEEATLPV